MSQQVFRTVEEELQFTADYLEFQKTRFRELFDYKRKIEIGVTEDNSRVIVVVEDNGVGIECSKALKATSGTQKGEDLLLNQAKQINKLYKRSIDINTIDKSIFDGAGSGTRVVLKLKKH